MVERFIAGVKKRYESPKPSHMVELEKRLPEAERRVRNVTEALAKVTDPDERVIAMLGARSANTDHGRGNSVATGPRSLSST